MKAAAVFFDLDGTLVDTAPDMSAALNRVLLAHHRAPVDEKFSRPLVSDGSIALLELGFGKLTSERRGPLREEFLSAYRDGIAERSALFSGMPEVLDELERSGCPWGVITNKPEALSILLLEQMQLLQRCCCLIGADTASHAKPHPAPMLLACQRCEVEPAHSIYVGDALRDIEAGNAVGMKTLVAEWGYLERTDAASWPARAWVSNPQQILSHL